jgi:ubiquinone/menaquinone biosynthesis C-methylase UbiE
VYHAFKNEQDEYKQTTFYKIPKEMGIFRTVGYDQTISTTEILEGWNKIWHKKGEVDTTDLQLLSGYENTKFDPKRSWDHIKKRFNVTNETILEVGSGPGYIAQHVDNVYMGIEQSYPLCEKCNTLAKKPCIQGEASNLPFKDNSFDYIICIGVLQYFPDHAYTRKALGEMKRVARKGVYIGSIRYKTHDKKLDKHIYKGPITHLLHSPDMFPEFEEDKTFYNKAEYFNMFFR